MTNRLTPEALELKPRCVCGRFIKWARGLCDDCFEAETREAYERVMWRV